MSILKQSAALVLTNRCTAACDICCMHCSPERNDVMPESLMYKAIENLEAAGEFKAISFSGGEPFLYTDLLKKGIKRAKEAGFSVSIATNGFWGAWPQDERNSFFEDAKPDMISFSTDLSHKLFVSDETFGIAVNTAKSLKIDFTILIHENKTGSSAREQFNAMGDYKYLSNIEIYPHARAGNASNFPEDAFYRFTPLKEARCSERGLITIRYDGNIFPCCSPYVFDTKLSLGNLHTKSIEDMLNNDSETHFYRALQAGALPYLAEISKRQYGAVFPQACTGGCEVCVRLFGGDYFDEIKQAAFDWYGRFAVDRLLGR